MIGRASDENSFYLHCALDGYKDIENENRFSQTQRYVDRLRDYYVNGLFLRRTTEATIRKLQISNLLRLCFTEIKLSQVKEHASRYGRLGIWFSRDFIINKGGRPVIYIPFTAEISLLEESLRFAYKNSREHEEIHKSLKWALAFVKRMSNRRKEDYYSEMEWRIVYDENPKLPHFDKDKGEENAYRFKFSPEEVRIIIFPDEKAKEMSFNDNLINGFFSQHLPITVTLDDCDNF